MIQKLRKFVCFVTETGRIDRPLHDPSVRYRCFHPAELLKQKGHNCSVISAARFYENPNLDYDVYVFHRPNKARAGFSDIVRFLRQQGSLVIADYDDLIFGPAEIALESSAVKNGTLTPEKAVAAFSSNLAALLEFDMVTVSTEPLAEKLRQFNPGARVAVVPNIVPPSMLSLHSGLGTHVRQRPSTTIGYFAGTKSHDRDFPVVEAALHRVLLEKPELSLLIVGPVAVPRGIAALPNVRVAAVVNYFRLPSLMAMCATVIAPLESSTFNACKSRVKFLEAALSGCRLVTSAIPDMQAIGPEHLVLAPDADAWYEALSEIDGAGRRALASRNFAYLQDNLKIDGLETFGDL